MRLNLAGYPKDWGCRPRAPANALPPTGGTIFRVLNFAGAILRPLAQSPGNPAIGFRSHETLAYQGDKEGPNPPPKTAVATVKYIHPGGYTLLAPGMIPGRS